MTQQTQKAPPILAVVVLLLIGGAGYLVWQQQGTLSTVECVKAAIAQMQLANRGQKAPTAVASLSQSISLTPAQRHAFKAFRQCGAGALSVLQYQMAIGVRPRRLAMQHILLAASRNKTKQPKTRRIAWKLLKHKDWRVREVAFIALWQMEQRPAQRRKMWQRAVTDQHHFIRYIAAAASQRQTPPPTSQDALLHWLRDGMKTRKKHDHKGHNHKHDHGHKKGPGGVERWLRERALCQINEDYDWPGRRALINAMARWNTPVHQKIQWWLDALDDRKAEIRKAARHQIITQGKAAIPTLRLIFQRAPTPRKHRVAGLLAAIGIPAIPTLTALLSAKDPAIWYAAAKGLSQAGQKASGHQTGAVLVGLLCDLLANDPARRMVAARVLARLGTKGSMCLVKRLHMHPDPPVRKAAANGIGRQGQLLCGKATMPTCRQLASIALAPLSQAWNAPSPTLQAEAIWATGQLGQAARTMLPQLLAIAPIDELFHRPLQVQQAWLQAIVNIAPNDPRSQQHLQRWFLHPKAVVSTKLSMLFGLVRRSKQKPLTAQVLSWWLRGLLSLTPRIADATRALIKAHPQHHRYLTTQLLASKILPQADEKRQISVLRALAQWTHWKGRGAQEIGVLLQRQSLQAKEPLLQMAAARALLQACRYSPQLTSVSHWTKLLKHARWQVRMNAAKAIAILGTKGTAAIDVLVGCLGDQRRQVRRAAAIALGKMGKAAKRAMGPLRKAMGDRAVDVQHAAKRALADITTSITPIKKRQLRKTLRR